MQRRILTAQQRRLCLRQCPDISDFERRIDQNWNERKHLTELEFEMRTEIQSLVQRGDSLEEF